MSSTVVHTALAKSLKNCQLLDSDDWKWLVSLTIKLFKVYSAGKNPGPIAQVSKFCSRASENRGGQVELASLVL